MKAVILAGGFGTRLSEETNLIPKPMVQIGNKPILWHIMKIYSHYGINDFVICLGYRGYMIKEYFANYYLHTSDMTIDTATGQMEIHRQNSENWRISLIETGKDSMTGGRIKRIKDYLNADEDFFMTYGDGVADININELYKFHKEKKRLATVTAVVPPGRFGALEIDGNAVKRFSEKPRGDGMRINGGYFVLSPKVLDYIEGDNTIFERDPMEKLAAEDQLSAYFHNGFWQPMDTLREKHELEALWESGNALWKVW